MRLVTLLLLATLAGLIASSSAQLINRRAPSFSLPDSSFKQYDILDYRGKWLLVYFMQTNSQVCPTCRANSAKLEAASKKFSATASILSIVISPPEDQSTVAKYIQENKITSPVLFDMSQVTIAWFKATPTNNSVAMPHLFVVNPQGTIVRDYNASAMGVPTFQADLEGLLSGGTGKGK